MLLTPNFEHSLHITINIVQGHISVLVYDEIQKPSLNVRAPNHEGIS